MLLYPKADSLLERLGGVNVKFFKLDEIYINPNAITHIAPSKPDFPESDGVIHFTGGQKLALKQTCASVVEKLNDFEA